MWRIFTSMFISESSGRRVPLALLFALGLTFVASSLFGSPLPCPTAPVTTYQATGFQCAIEGYTLEDFTFSDSETGGATLLPPGEITVNPTFSTPASVAFQFFGAFSAATGQTEEYIVQYELDPLLPQITGEGIDLGPADPVTLTGQFCGNGMLVGPYVPGNPTNCSGTNTAGIFPLTLETTGNGTSTSALIPCDGHNRGYAPRPGSDRTIQRHLFRNKRRHYPHSSSVPEPSTSLWLAPGMLGLLWLRKKRLANAR